MDTLSECLASSKQILLVEGDHHLAVEPSNPVYYYLDRVQFKCSTRPTTLLKLQLENHASFVDKPRYCEPSYGRAGYYVVVVTVPDDELLRMVAALRWEVNGAELAQNTICKSDLEAEQLHDLCDRYLCTPWHGKHRMLRCWNEELRTIVSYSGQRRDGLRYAWYHDVPCKVTGELSCFHFEARHMGAAAMRRLGIHSPLDLIGFAEAYWENDRSRTQGIDFARLGRWHQNQLEGRSRKKSRLVKCGSGFYHVDHRMGCTLFRALGWSEKKEFLSVQSFLDFYGRGPFLTAYPSILIMQENANSRLTH